MLRRFTIKKQLIRRASKAAILSLLAISVFSSFGQVFQTQVVQAAAADYYEECASKGFDQSACVDIYNNCQTQTSPTGCMNQVLGISSTEPTNSTNNASEHQQFIDGCKKTAGEAACNEYYNLCQSQPQDQRATCLSNFLTPQEKAAAAGSNSGCSISGGVAECLAEVVYLFTVGLGTGAAWIGAWVFSLAVQLSLNSTAYALGFLSDGWVAVRDIANMFFILILVYIAFTIMFKAETADTMKRLAWVVIIALIINFSFFITRVVIDTGNLMAVQFYNAIPNHAISENVNVESPNFVTDSFGTKTKDLTYSIMEGVGVQKILGTPSFKAFQQQNTGLSGFFTKLVTLSILYIALGAMFFILAAAFFTIGIKFIMRIVVLWLLIVASPLAFIAFTTDHTKKFFNQWQKALFHHAFYPAVFLFVFYILTLFMKNLGDETVIERVFGDASRLSSHGMEYLISLIAIISIYMGFVIALLYMGMKAADYIGLEGGNLVNKYTSKVPFMQGLSSYRNYGSRVGGLAYQRTIGLAAGKFNDQLKRYPSAGPLGGLFQRIDYNLRKGVLEPASKKSFGGAASYADVVERNKAIKKDWDANKDAADDRNLAKRSGGVIEGNIAAGKAAATGLTDADLERLQRFNKAQIEAMDAKQIKNLSAVFTESQMKIVQEMEKLSTRDREDAHKIWMSHSSSSPAGKLRDQVKLLREIRDKLKFGGGVTLPKVDSHTTPSSATVKTVLASTELEEMRDEIKDALSDMRQKSRDNSLVKADRKLAERNAINLQEAVNALKDMGENLKKVPDKKFVVE